MRETCKDTTSSEGMSCLDWNVWKTKEVLWINYEGSPSWEVSKLWELRRKATHTCITVATCCENMSKSLISAGIPGPSSRWANRANLGKKNPYWKRYRNLGSGIINDILFFMLFSIFYKCISPRTLKRVLKRTWDVADHSCIFNWTVLPTMHCTARFTPHTNTFQQADSSRFSEA